MALKVVAFWSTLFILAREQAELLTKLGPMHPNYYLARKKWLDYEAHCLDADEIR